MRQRFPNPFQAFCADMLLRLSPPSTRIADVASIFRIAALIGFLPDKWIKIELFYQFKVYHPKADFANP
jgi:hypothetical protein